MKRITTFRQLITVGVAILVFQISFWAKQDLPEKNVIREAMKSGLLSYSFFIAMLSVLIGYFTSGPIIKFFLLWPDFKRLFLRGCYIEGLWYVEWWDEGVYKGNELSRFWYDCDAHCIREQTIRFKEGKPIVARTISTTLDDDLQYSSLYEYDDTEDSAKRYGVAMGTFESRNSANPNYFRFNDHGIQDRYHEVHFGLPVPQKIVKSYKKERVANWEQNLLKHYESLNLFNSAG